MKVNRKNRRLKSFTVLLLVTLMAVTSGVSGFLNMSGSSATNNRASRGYILNQTSDKLDFTEYVDEDILIESGPSVGPDDYINVIITVDNTSLTDMYLANPGKASSLQEYLSTSAGRKNIEYMKQKQESMYREIARRVNATVVASYTAALNGFGVKIKNRDLEQIEGLGNRIGYSSVSVSKFYPISDAAVETQAIAEPIYNSVDVHDSGIFNTDRVPLADAAGTGMLIGVLDSGLDYDHEAFSDENLPGNWRLRSNNNIVNKEDYKNNKDAIYFDVDESALKLSYADLNNTPLFRSLSIHGFNPYITTNQVYKKDKVPFSYDYVDLDTEVNVSEQNAHGTHVSGIVAGESDMAEKFWPDGTPRYQPNKPHTDEFRLVGMKGAAPKAQILAMKVFGDHKHGGESITMISALNDCVLLGVDVINMSLGLGSGFTDLNDDEPLQAAYENVDDAGISLIVSAGNGYTAARGGHFGTNLTANPDSGVLGSPASLYESFAVASIEGVQSKYLVAQNSAKQDVGVAYFADAGKPNGERFNFIEGIQAAATARGYNKPESMGGYMTDNGTWRIPYVSIPGTGESGDYAGKTTQVRNAIALIPRGVTSFTEKLTEAKLKGALGAIIYNNVAGAISMSLEDKIGDYPACSILMDAAAAFKNFDGYIEISKDFTAGPFMSDFSSWGPTPNLELKPEITGHGGEIYSAYPGDNYDRISGTSMSAPNIAGLTLLARQYFTEDSATAREKAEQFGLLKDDDSGEIDAKRLQRRIYQLMMSTATIPKDEWGNQYFPRRIGAGVADIYSMLGANEVVKNPETQLNETKLFEGTPAYIYVKDPNGMDGEKDRTKLDLYDDPKRTGIYPLEFVVRNTGDTPLYYRPDVSVLTEGISTDRKTVAERAYPLEKEDIFGKDKNGNDRITAETDNKDSVFDASKKMITVPAGADVTVKINVELAQSARNYLEATYTEQRWDRENRVYYTSDPIKRFENGMYVEGFAMLTAVDSTGENEIARDSKNALTYEGFDLNIPYLAFYGDWTDAPMFDCDIYTSDAEERDGTVPDDAKIWPQGRPMQPIAKMTQSGVDYTYPIGAFIFTTPDIYEDTWPLASQDRTCLSLSSESAYQLYYASGFLRPCKEVTYTVTEKSTGKVLLDNGRKINARKDGMYSNMGGVKVEIDPRAIGCRNNGTYTFTLYGYLDTGNLKGNDEQGNPRATSHYYTEDADGNPRNTWSFDFTVDTDAPMLSDAQVRIERDNSMNETRYLDLYLYDDNYLNAMSFNLWDEKGKVYESIWDKGIRPLTSGKGVTSRVSFDLNPYWDHLKKNGYKISFNVFDYAYNETYYEIQLYDPATYTADNPNQLYTAAESIDLADIGIYSDEPYTYGDKELKLMDSYKTDKTDPDNYTQLERIDMRVNQSIELKYALVASPSSYWSEDIVWRTQNKDIVAVNDDLGEYGTLGTDFRGTGEIFGVAPGEVNLTVYSARNPDAKRTIKVKVWSDTEIQNYGAQIVDTNNLIMRQARFKDNQPHAVQLKAGEEYKVSVEPSPWFLTEAKTNSALLSRIKVEWSSSDRSVATVVPGNPNSLTQKFNATVVVPTSGWRDILDVYGQPTTEPVYYDGTDVWTVKKDAQGNFLEGDDDGYVKDQKWFKDRSDLLDDDDNDVKFDANGDLIGNNPPAKRKLQKYYNNYTDGSTQIRATLRLMAEDGITVLSTVYTPSLNVYALPEFVVEAGVLTEYHGIGGTVIIPDSMNITEIGDRCFVENNYIRRVIIPEGVTRVGRAAFAYCTNLSEVRLPATINLIDEWAFGGLRTRLDGNNTRLQIVDTTKFREPVQIGKYAFQNQVVLGTNLRCQGDEILASGGGVVVDYEAGQGDAAKFINRKYLDLSKVRVIGQQAFTNCQYLTYVDLSSVRSMGGQALTGMGFFGTKILDWEVTVNLSEDTFLGDDAFYGSGISASGTINHETNVVTRDTESVGGQTIPVLNIPIQRILCATFIGNSAVKINFTSTKGLVIEQDAFAASDQLKYVEFKGNLVVESIGANAFGSMLFSNNTTQSCSIESIEWNDSSVKRIEQEAFKGASALGTFTLPMDLEYIGADAFSGCTALTTVNVPADFNKDLKVMSAFNGCTNFDTINIIGTGSNYSVNGANNILYREMGDYKEIVFVAYNIVIASDGEFVLDSNVRIADYGFAGNKNIKKVIAYEAAAAGFGEGAFKDCVNLESVILPQGMTAIPSHLFDGCTSLDEVLVGDSSIGDPVANGFSGVKYIGHYAFNNTAITAFEATGLVATQIPLKDRFGNAVKDARGNPVLETIPGIGKYAFAGTELTTFSIPVGVTEIAEGVFMNSKLTDVTLHNNVTYIGREAFAYTDIVNFNTNTNGIKAIGDRAFYGCSDLKKVSLPECLTIGEYAFYGRSEVSNGVFENGSIDQLRIEKVTVIKRGAFMYQDTLGLNGTQRLAALETIGDYAFAYSKLDSLNMNKVKSIGEGAFEGTELTGTITLPATVKTVGAGAFAGADGIKAFKVDSEDIFTVIDGVLFRKGVTGLELIQYPAGKAGYNYAIPEGTFKVGDKAFYAVKSLHSVTFPESLVSIGHAAFYQTPGLSQYRFLSLNAPVLEGWFASYTIEDDQFSYNWATYNNFYGYLTIPEVVDDGNGEYVIKGDYLFNTIRKKSAIDSFTLINSSIKGASGSQGADYGLVMLRPRNGIGYENFIYSNYFSVIITDTKEAVEPNTRAIINGINSLPDKGELLVVKDDEHNEEQDETKKKTNHAYKILSLREAYNSLTLGQQPLVTNIAKLNTLEEYAVAHGMIFNVTFILADGSTTSVVAKNAKVKEQPEPANGSYAFDNWYLNEKVYNFNQPVTGDLMIYARWKGWSATWTVIFTINRTAYSVQVAHNGIVAAPQNTSEFNTTYVNGWRLGNGEAFDFNTPITKNMQLFANLITFKVTYKGCSYGSVNVDGGTILEKPADPTRKGYKFTGWEVNGDAYEFDTAITRDMTIQATWVKTSGCGSGTISSGFDAGTLTMLLTAAMLLGLLTAMTLRKRAKKSK